MKVDRSIWGSMDSVAEQVRGIEAAGLDGVAATEVISDPFLPLTIAAEHSERVELMTSITVAFARSPMTLAQIGHDLNQFSKGRMILGLGSQIKPHITKRFSMPWSKPAARMREYVQAMRAIWACWHEGERLNFRGEFYDHTLMTPNFQPPETTYGAPKVFVAAVGQKMTEVAGEVADGIIAHGFTTPRYMREVTLPALERGLEAAGRTRSDIQLSCPVFGLVANNDQELESGRAAIKKQIAFYGSTPAYRPVLDLHGWGDLQTDLNQMSKLGKWDEMGELITEEIFDEFAFVSTPQAYADEVIARYGGMIDRVGWNTDIGDADVVSTALEKLHSN